MAKSKATKQIEKILLDSCFGTNPSLATEYGTMEVTIDFQRNKSKKEIVDFMTYDAKKDIIKCYEIKVSIQDLHSDAQKSWYGHYNYLVITNSLYLMVPEDDWKKELPKGVGLIVINPDTREKWSMIKATKQTVDDKTKEMLKRSLIRTLFYKWHKLQNTKLFW